jgi:hypothetical protein
MTALMIATVDGKLFMHGGQRKNWHGMSRQALD